MVKASTLLKYTAPAIPAGAYLYSCAVPKSEMAMGYRFDALLDRFYSKKELKRKRELAEQLENQIKYECIPLSILIYFIVLFLILGIQSIEFAQTRRSRKMKQNRRRRK